MKKYCKDCGKEFEQKPNSRYTQKYCKSCSEERKKAYEKIHLITAEECEE